MTILEILLIAIGLAMDAFAVSICKGLLPNCSRRTEKEREGKVNAKS